MAGIAHEVRPPDMLRSPKGKVPYVDLDGRLIGDSQLVIDELVRLHGDTLDAHLDARQRAIGHAVRRMLEEGTYFTTLYLRWIDDEGFRVLRPAFGAIFPAALRPLLFPMIRNQIRKSLRGQGTGRHTKDEIVAFAKRDIDALSGILGESEYLLGDRPSSYDATVYAFCEGMLGFPHPSGVLEHARTKTNLVAYRARVRARWFADLGPVPS
ncbi:Glutathione S-transferase [Sandaracinus amylolyticus]|nr:Glutathione S-transferase [Sandaracinus amylolyticus]